MRRLVLVALAAFLACTPPAGSAAAAASSDPGLRSADQSLERDVQRYFAFWTPATVREYRVRVGAVRSAARMNDRLAFDRAAALLLSGLQNGHTGFTDTWQRVTYNNDPGIYARPVQGRWTIVESSVPALPAGTVITQLNGQPAQLFMRAVEDRVVAGSRPGDSDAMAFRFTWAFPQVLAVTTSSGKTVVIHTHRTQADPLTKINGHLSDDVRMLDGSIAYIRIHSFAQPEDEATAVDAVRRFANYHAIVFDVRDNQGGATPNTLIESLLRKSAPWWRERSTIRKPVHFVYTPARHPFSGKVVVIINQGCHSACEDFLMPLKWTKRAVLVGVTTSGSTGQPFFRALPNGMLYQIGATHVYFPDGSPFEGKGIAPDVVAGETLQDIRFQRDSVLEAALAQARR